MATPENTFIQGVHKHLPADLYRMKNHNQYNGGIPDVWYSGPAGDLWIEYKFITLPKRDDTIITVDLSHLQVDWLKSRHAEGRQVGVIVGTREGGVWLPGLRGVSGSPRPGGVSLFSTAEFRCATRTRKGLAELITELTTST